MITVKALIIREEPSGETSKNVYALTAERGVIRIYVRGGYKSRKNSAATQLFVYSEICAEEKKNPRGETYYYLNSAEPINLFFDLRLDVYKTALSAYLTDILYYSRIEFASDKNDILRLTLNTLYYINEGKKDRALLKSIFEFRLLCDTGLRPNLIGCSQCYKYEDEKMYFNMYSGDLKCEECCNNKESLVGFVFDPKMLYIVRHIALTDFERLFAIEIAPKYQKQLTEFTERYVKYHYNEKFDTLLFYNSL
ncbi:MAG: DNA repair protein RecO [Ruminococcus sp.]|nr:DNA repair protein RecO [Ruminococcus sp.]